MEPHNEQAAGEVLHQRGWRKAFTVQEMVDKWAWLVGEVEDAYRASTEVDAIDQPRSVTGLGAD